MKIDCNICKEITADDLTEHGPIYAELVKTGRNQIAQTEHFLVLPSIGPLNASHAMIVPKEHVNSFGLLPALNAEKLKLIKQLQKYYLETFNQALVFFESGAGNLVNHSGGCIVHAHIHAVTAQEEFRKRLFDEVNLVRIENDIPKVDVKYGYIWYLDANSQEHLCNNPMLPSQFLRYTYAQGAHNKMLWNWRRHENIVGVQRVLDNYKAFQSWQEGSATSRKSN